MCSFKPFQMIDYFGPPEDSYWFREMCRSVSGIALSDQLHNVSRVQLLSEIRSYMKERRNELSKYKLSKGILYNREMEKTEIKLRELINQEEWHDVLKCFSNQYLAQSGQPIHLCILAEVYFRDNNKNKAEDYVNRAIKEREAIKDKLGVKNISVATLDYPFLPHVMSYIHKEGDK